MAIGSGNGDWTSAAERSVADEWQRRLTSTRWALGIACTVGAVALALLAWQVSAMSAQTRTTTRELAREVAREVAGDIANTAAERVSTRHVAPLLQTDAEVYANQVALARHQVDLEARLRALEAEAAQLQRLLGARTRTASGR